MAHKKTTILAATLAASLGGGGALAYQTSQNSGFDFKSINETISAALAEVSATQEKIQSLNYSFIPERTSVAQDKYGLNVTLELAESPWADADLKANGTVHYALVQEDGQPKSKLDVTATLKTDPLAGMKWLVRAATTCPVPADTVGIQRVFAKDDCKVVGKIAKASSLPQLRRVIRRHLRDHRRSTRRYVRSLRRTISRTRADTVAHSLKRELKRARAVKRAVKRAVNRARVVHRGEGFTARIPAFTYGSELRVTKLQFSAHPNRLKFAVGLRTPYGTTLYNAAKPEIVRILKGLQENEPTAQELIEIDGRLFGHLLDLVYAGDSDRYTNTV